MSLTRVITYLAIFYIVFVYFFGIVVKFTINYDFLFYIKSYIPELILFFIISLCAIAYGKKINRLVFVIYAYLLLLFIASIFYSGISNQCLYILRDCYAPILLFCSLSLIKFRLCDYQLFDFFLIRFFKFYLIFGLFFCLFQHIKGAEWCAEFFTGYVFYGVDEYSKIKICHNFGFLRAPGFCGNYSIFGNYCLISFIYVLFKKKERFKFFWIIISGLNLVLSTNKSAIMAYFVILLYFFSIKVKLVDKRQYIFLLYFILLVAICLFFINNPFSYIYQTALFMRIEFWYSSISDINFFAMIFPFNQFEFGAGGDSFLSTCDNTYLYSFLTIGCLGCVFVTYLLFKEYKFFSNYKLIENKRIIFAFFLGLIVAGATLNLFQGRGYITPVFMILGFMYKNTKPDFLKKML